MAARALRPLRTAASTCRTPLIRTLIRWSFAGVPQPAALAGVGPCKWMHSPDLCDPAAPHMADSESVCATWLAAGKTCASTWSEVCGATHSVYNDYPLSMSGCSQCMGSGGSGLGSGSSSGSGGEFPCVNGELDSTWGGDCDYLRYVVSNDVESQLVLYCNSYNDLATACCWCRGGGAHEGTLRRRLQSPDPSVAPATPPIMGWVPPSSSAPPCRPVSINAMRSRSSEMQSEV